MIADGETISNKRILKKIIISFIEKYVTIIYFINQSEDIETI